MTKKSIALLALFAAACSSGPDPVEQQKRIAELERQNSQLEAELTQAKKNVAALQRAMTRSVSDAGAEDSGGAEGAAAPQPVNPTPDNNLSGTAAQ